MKVEGEFIASGGDRIVVLLAAWYAWRYYNLRRHVDDYASQIRGQDINTNTQGT